MSEVLKRIRMQKGFTKEYMAEKQGYKDKSGYSLGEWKRQALGR